MGRGDGETEGWEEVDPQPSLRAPKAPCCPPTSWDPLQLTGGFSCLANPVQDEDDGGWRGEGGRAEEEGPMWRESEKERMAARRDKRHGQKRMRTDRQTDRQPCGRRRASDGSMLKRQRDTRAHTHTHTTHVSCRHPAGDSPSSVGM